MSNYRIVLRGVKPGRSVDEVATALARYSKKSPEKLRALLASGKHMVAKRTALSQQATQFKMLLDKMGCDCLIEAEITGHLDSANTTSVLVTDIEDPASTQRVPRRGVSYTQRTRSQEFMESIGRIFRPRIVMGLIALLGLLYYGREHLQSLIGM